MKKKYAEYHLFIQIIVQCCIMCCEPYISCCSTEGTYIEEDDYLGIMLNAVINWSWYHMTFGNTGYTWNNKKWLVIPAFLLDFIVSIILIIIILIVTIFVILPCVIILFVLNSVLLCIPLCIIIYCFQKKMQK